MPKRIVFIDYIRVVACFLVMLVHSSENFYCYTADTSMLANESNRLWVAIFDGGFGRISVPLFMSDDSADPVLPIYLTIPCMALMTFAISAAITKFISLIPSSKWVIG